MGFSPSSVPAPALPQEPGDPAGIIFLAGPPASGKSTMGATVAQEFGFVHINMGEQMRFRLAGLATDAASPSAPSDATCPGGGNPAPRGECSPMSILQDNFVPGGIFIVDGFPRDLDGFDEFAKQWSSLARSAVMVVLQVSDADVLLRRADSRARETERTESAMEVLQRVGSFHRNTTQVIEQFSRQGRAHFVDASLPRALVLAAIRVHLTPSVVFVSGKPGCGKTVVCGDLARVGPYRHIKVGDLVRLSKPDQSASLAPSADVVKLIWDEIRRQGWLGTFLLDGFPRSFANLDSWSGCLPPALFAQPQILHVHLDCSSKTARQRVLNRSRDSADSEEGLANRMKVFAEETQPFLQMNSLRAIPCGMITFDNESTEQEVAPKVQKAVQGCTPLAVCVPQAAQLMLRAWLEVVNELCWWDPPVDDALPRYARCLWLAKQGSVAALPADSWLLWITHCIFNETYQRDCGKHLQGVPSLSLRMPLVGKAANQVNKSIEALDGNSAIQGLEAALRATLTREAVVKTGQFFIDLLVSLQEHGLSPLSDPRVLAMDDVIPEKFMALLGVHYRRFLHKMGAGEPMAMSPTVEIDWLWHAHLLNHGLYKSDCTRLFGRIVHHRASPPIVGEEGDDGHQQRSALDEAIRVFRDHFDPELQKLKVTWLMCKDDDDDDISTLASLVPARRSRLKKELREHEFDMGLTLAAAAQSRVFDADGETWQSLAGSDDEDVEEVPVGPIAQPVPKAPREVPNLNIGAAAEAFLYSLPKGSKPGPGPAPAPAPQPSQETSAGGGPELRICLMSGEEVHTLRMPRTVKDLKDALVKAGEQPYGFQLLVGTVLLEDPDAVPSDVLEEQGEDTIILLRQTLHRCPKCGLRRPNMVDWKRDALGTKSVCEECFEAKTCNRCRKKVEDSDWCGSDWHCNACERSRRYSCRCCSCFTEDCTFLVHSRRKGECTRRLMRDLKVGDLVHTGQDEETSKYRRVTRIWATELNCRTMTATMSPGCRLTAGHPVWSDGRWQKPEKLTVAAESYESKVYTLELEGHVDTILVGDTVCAALGVYCGADFGWNVFTRKTTRCDETSCRVCDAIVHEDVDFARVSFQGLSTQDTMSLRFPPHPTL